MLRPVYMSARRISRLAALSTVSTLALVCAQASTAYAADCATVNAGGIYFTCNGDDQDIPVGGVTLTPTSSETLVKILGTPPGDTELTNEELLKATIAAPANSTANTASLFGVTLNDADNVDSFKFTNNGTIDLTHNGVGALAGVYAIGGAADDGFLIINNGAITVTRGPLTNETNTINVSVGATNTFTARANGLANATVNIAAGLRIDEEETFQARLENNGSITASGTLSYGIFGRATAFEIVNEGTISASGNFSAAIVTWDGRANTTDSGTSFRTYGKTFLDNHGTINGDVFVIDASRETFARTGAANTADLGTLDVIRAIDSGQDPFTLLGATRSPERRDSEINNTGTINGNLYLFAGAHAVTNAQDAEINGNIVVDQRRTILYSAGANHYGVASRFTQEGEEEGGDEEGLSENYYATPAELVAADPEHHFTLDNAGALNGDVKIFTYTGPASATAAASTVDLVTHITGSGAGSAIDDPSTNSGYINGKLSIGTGTYPNITTSTVNTVGGATVTLTPKIDSLVHNNEFFYVAKNYLPGNSPTLNNTSFLVDWSVQQHAIGANNALVLGSTVAGSSIVEGLSGAGAATLDGLLNTNSDNAAFNALGGALESLSNGDDVRKAAEQLAPDTSFAVQQAAFTLAALQGSAIDQRLGGSVASGGATGTGFAPPSGLGMGQGDVQRMNLSAGDDEFRPNYGPSREGAWGQAFGAHLNQDTSASVGNFGADIWGFMAGYDNSISPGFRVGGAFGYAMTNISEEGDHQGDRTDDESYTGVAYAAYRTSGWYMTGRTGFTWHNYDTVRKLTVPVNDEAIGSHEASQYNASGEVGAPMRFLGSTFTPLASLTYNYLDQDSYTESSAAGMALNVNSQKTDSLVSGLGLRSLVPIAAGTAIEGRAIWLHEFSDTNQIVTASFIGADTSFTAAGANIGRDSANLGAGVTFDSGTGYSFQLNYDSFIRDDFVAQAGSGRVRVQF